MRSAVEPLLGSQRSVTRKPPVCASGGELCSVSLKDGADLAGFRSAARHLIAAGVAPDNVVWEVGALGLFEGEPMMVGAAPLVLPRAVAEWIPLVLAHRDPERHALLYALIWRVSHGERDLLDRLADPMVHRLHRICKAVRRDLHKMHAFLRFRRIATNDGERFMAWFEPDHRILEAAAPFFVDRFRALDWSILTPDGSAHWDDANLSFGPPGRREDVPANDEFEAGWRGYYESTFNPARLNLAAMRSEMPKKYWRNMPESAAIPELVRRAATRTATMIETKPEMPAKRAPAKAVAAMADQDPASLDALNAIIRRSQPLVPGASQAVLGQGPVGARLVFVGEQPGDQEDRQGRPFVGPAGQLLSRAMEEAGILRADTYLTNAVKHFKFTMRGKRRVHEKPSASEVSHYRWWLDRELDFVAPRLVVALGATAVLALSGKQVPITRARGPADFGDKPYRGFITVHPSYLLRLPDPQAKALAYRAFVDDLRRVAAIAAERA